MAVKVLVTTLCITLVVISTHVRADNQQIEFGVKPNRCIALHQGQTCYQKLKFHWQTPASGEYCLFQTSEAEPLVCWKGKEKASFMHEFKSDSSIIYQIRIKNQTKSLSSVKVKVAWVYRSSRKSASGWRLF
ncbi:MAG: DUF3019 domain-containing protein [Pseudomonadales bacterium]